MQMKHIGMSGNQQKERADEEGKARQDWNERRIDHFENKKGNAQTFNRKQPGLTVETSTDEISN